MMQRIRNIQYTGDPLTLAARSNEIECLVRLLYRLSRYLNETVIILSFFIFFLFFSSHFTIEIKFVHFQYAVEIEQCYRRSDLIGRIARRILESPRIVQSFEKSHGSSNLVERRLRPRINLRGLASYRTIIQIIILSVFIGKLLGGSLIGGSFFGLFMLIVSKAMLTLILASYEVLFES